MSAQGDPTDYDYDPTTTSVTQAVGGSDPDAGQVGDIITCLIPHSEHYLFFGCMNEIYVMIGDPADGGSLKNVSHSVGIVDRNAWCHGANEEIFILAPDGLYMMNPRPDFTPQPLSRDKLPQELQDVDNSLYEVNLAYDAEARGVYIFVTSKSGGETYHWWYDIIDGGFWKWTLDTDNEPRSVYRRVSDVLGDNAVLLGCNDGYIRSFNESATRDDGTAYTTYVDYGPIRLGGSNHDRGKVMSLRGALGDRSGDATLGVYVSDTNEGLVGASAFGTYTLSSGLNYTYRPQCTGGSMKIRLTGTSGERFMIEKMMAVIENTGEERLA